MLDRLAFRLALPLAERRLAAWFSRWDGTPDLSLALELWNGHRFKLGSAPPVTLRLASPQALGKVLHPSLDSLGSAYVEGLIDIEGSMSEVVRQVVKLSSHVSPGRRTRLQRARHTRGLDAVSIEYHYDVSNEFYQLWLDEGMVYSCAYFVDPQQRLEQAQLQKIDHVLRKIRLQPGQRLLDIGCGWGALAIRAAQHFGAQCVGITLSQRQFELARQRVAEAGLEDRVEIRLQDYRDVSERYARITSVGMFEHVGLDHLRSYFARIADLLDDDGVALNHGITSTDPQSAETPLGGGSFIDRYVFPNGELPHIGLALQEMSAAGLEATDVENLRLHYALTLQHWSRRFEAQAPRLRELVGEKRFRIWRAYLAGCAYAFEQNWISLHQIVSCKPGHLGRHALPLTRHYMYN